MNKKESPILRLFMAMVIGLLVIETAIELSTGKTLLGGRNGIFVSHQVSNAKTVNTPMQAQMRVIQNTDIHESPSPQAMKVGKLKIGTSLRVVGKTTVDKQVWYQIDRYGGKIGYIVAQAVTRK